MPRNFSMVIVSRVLEAALDLVAGLVAFGQYAEAKCLDVHDGAEAPP